MRRTWVASAVLALATAAVRAQTTAGPPTCLPATSPCQVCPTPVPCGSPTADCPNIGNQSFSFSTQSCTGGFPQQTTQAFSTIGPADVCTGPNLSLACHVPAGTINFNTITQNVSVAAAAVPALSITAIATLVVLLGALALRRLGGS